MQCPTTDDLVMNLIDSTSFIISFSALADKKIDEEHSMREREKEKSTNFRLFLYDEIVVYFY